MATAKKATFRTTLLTAGKTATGIHIPDKIVEDMGAGKKPPVKVTINGYTYRNTVAVMGGVYMVGVSAEHRKGANVAGGDEIDVTLELDTAPREVEVPEELQKALNKNPKAKKAFEALSNSRKQVYTLSVKDAKTHETRQRRIEKAIAQLTEGK
ncbi:MAG: hypothetical protein JWQ38_3221 [Flavipsychrobacter sp.]|nr:hypothetical protein [Flavipsychrobacter sp.]